MSDERKIKWLIYIQLAETNSPQLHKDDIQFYDVLVESS